MKTPSRRPTDAEYAAYDGMHCRWLWRETPESWRCPACGRSKRGILVWGKRVGSNAANYGPVGFKAGLHEHHDHGSSLGDCDFEGLGARFRPVVICGSCNTADAIAKRDVGAPDNFSFSPEEIRRFVIARDNHGHRFDFARARQIYRRVVGHGVTNTTVSAVR
jgi:hypothetical protein